MENLIEINFTKNECDKSLIDSCLLIYLLDTKDLTKHHQAISWFDSIEKNTFLSAQNIREFASNCLAKNAPTGDILDLIELFSSKFIILQDDQLDTKNAIELCKGNQKLFWDASLVSVMKRNGIDCILTENTKDFKTLGVRAVNPLK